MPNALISQIVLPVDVSGVMTDTTFDIKDAYARQAIQDLGDALYWVGITTTALSDGATTNPITVGGESVTVKLGGLAQYIDSQSQPLEFVWNGTTWQEFGYSNLGALAFKSSAEATYTPAGSVTVTPSQGADTTTAIVGVDTTNVPSAFSVTNEVLTITPGTAAVLSSSVNAVTASGTVTATAAFVGTEATITVQ